MLRGLPGLRKWACGGTQIQYHLGSIERQNAVNKKSAELPTTIDGAARLMLGLVPEDEQTRISHMRENDLTELHMGLGQWVRNYLGLWGVNSDFLAVTGEPNADDASAVIVGTFWSALRSQLPKCTDRESTWLLIYRKEVTEIYNRRFALLSFKFSDSGHSPWLIQCP
jgi:hypothetical protein